MSSLTQKCKVYLQQVFSYSFILRPRELKKQTRTNNISTTYSDVVSKINNSH